MPDIAMCHGQLDHELCSLREQCHRYKATPDPLRQSYMEPPAVGGDCEYYWPVKWEPKRKDGRENAEEAISIQENASKRAATDAKDA